jgi:hypothetical protein
MLNKQVCMKCINKQNNSYNSWNEEDNNRWNKGMLFCCCYSKWRVKNIKEGIPEYCPYKLEHLLKGN